MQLAMNYIGLENLEDLALKYHKPAPAIYVYVGLDGEIKNIVRNADRIEFNTKCKFIDYYSGLVSMQKPIKSKLILSNNWCTFWCRNVEKLKDSDIDEYFEAAGLPEKYSWYADFIKNSIRTVEKKSVEVVKFFLLESAKLYRELGLKNWMEKSNSKTGITKRYKGFGYPLGCSNNSKKPYIFSPIHLVTDEKALQVKLFYDILKGLRRRGYGILYVSESQFIPLKRGQLPDYEIIGGIVIAFEMDNGNSHITHIDSVVHYTPWI
jgi:hypothetical protein